MSDPRFLQKGFDKRLAHLVEEIGELQVELGGILAAAGKTQRWGVWSVDPTIPPADRETNLAWLRRKMSDAYREMADVHEAIARLEISIVEEFTGGEMPAGRHDEAGNFVPSAPARFTIDEIRAVLERMYAADPATVARTLENLEAYANG